jgi:hypothetical protein
MNSTNQVQVRGQERTREGSPTWLFSSSSMLLIRQELGAASSNAQQIRHSFFQKNTLVIMEESPQSKNEHNAIQTYTSGYLYEDVARLNVLEHVWDVALAYRPPCPCVGDSIGKP